MPVISATSPGGSAATLFSQDSLSASGKSAERLSLPSFQSKMKSDPGGYLSELRLPIGAPVDHPPLRVVPRPLPPPLCAQPLVGSRRRQGTRRSRDVPCPRVPVLPARARRVPEPDRRVAEGGWEDVAVVVEGSLGSGFDPSY